MTDAWDDMRKAKEEQYFQKQNQEAFERLKARDLTKPRISPVSGKPMVQETLMGVNIDKCTESGGIWLDAGELEALIKAATTTEEEGKSWLAKVFGNVVK